MCPHRQHRRGLEGQTVIITFTDGSCIRDCTLDSAARGPVHSLWLDLQGQDLFVPITEVLPESSLDPRNWAA